MVTVFFLIGVVCLLLAVHPFVTYPLSLAAARRLGGVKPALAGQGNYRPRVSICCSAYNEASVIEEKARNMIRAASECEDAGIWFYVDGATDDTVDRLAAFGEQINVISAPERRGKSYGMNELVRHADADIIVFTDANVMFEKDAVARINACFQDPTVGCVCGHLRYRGTDASGTAMAGGLYWRLEERIKQLESDTGSVMGADGSIFAIRRSLHTPVPDDIIDDMYLSLDILCRGHRIIRAPDVVAYEQAIPAASDEFRRKIRISCQAFNVHKLLWPRIRRRGFRDVYRYASHKLLRWFAGFFLAAAWLFLMLGSLAAGWGLQAFLITAGLLLLPGTGLLGNNRPGRAVAGILAAFAATGLGIVESLRGKRYQVWSLHTRARASRRWTSRSTRPTT